MTDHEQQIVDEWQKAAIVAAGCRLLHDAKLYGFITGGPSFDIERVDQVLGDAAKAGVVPTIAEAQQAALDLIAEANDA